MMIKPGSIHVMSEFCGWTCEHTSMQGYKIELDH